MVNEFLKAFLNDLYKIPLDREINIGVNLLSDTHPIFISPYRMDLVFPVW